MGTTDLKNNHLNITLRGAEIGGWAAQFVEAAQFTD